MDDQRAGQFAVTFANGVRLVRLPPGLAAGWWHLPFVLSGPVEVMDEMRKRDKPWAGIPECLEFESPYGPFTPWPSAGGSGAGLGISNIEYRFEAGLPWLRLRYRQPETKETVGVEDLTLG